MVMSTVKKVTDFGEKPGPITILFSCAKVLMETEIGIIIGQVCYTVFGCFSKVSKNSVSWGLPVPFGL